MNGFRLLRPFIIGLLLLLVAPSNSLFHPVRATTPFDFSLKLAPTTISIVAGGTAAYDVEVDLVSGIPSPVTLSIVQSLPAGILTDESLSAISGTPPFRSELSVAAASTIGVPSKYSLHIQGVSGGTVHDSYSQLCLLKGQNNIALACDQAESETATAVDPNNSNHIVGASNYGGSGKFFASFDEGQSWLSYNVIYAIPLLGTLNLSLTFSVTDPSLAFDGKSNIYLGELVTNSSHSGVLVARSTDGGRSFDSAKLLTVDGNDLLGRHANDKPYLAIDMANDNLYIAWSKLGILGTQEIVTSACKNASSAFPECFPASPSSVGILFLGTVINALGSVPAVGPNGVLYVAWLEELIVPLPFPRIASFVVVAKSADFGKTFIHALFREINEIPCPLSPTAKPALDIACTGKDYFRTKSLPTIAVDNSNGANRGSVYVAWADQTCIGFIFTQCDDDILLTRSTDGGVTWKIDGSRDTIQVNNDKATGTVNGKDQLLPWISVAPNGRVDIISSDRRNSQDNTVMDAYLATSMNGGISFANVKVSEDPSDPEAMLAGSSAPDYQGITSTADATYLVWTDTRNVHGFDAYFAKVSTPVLKIEAGSPVDVMVTDAYGQRIGSNSLGTFFEIPGATYTGSGSEPQVLTIVELTSTTYTISLTGRDQGSFELSATMGQASASLEGQISTGQVINYTLGVSLSPPEVAFQVRGHPPIANAGLDLSIEGNTVGGANVHLDGTRSSSADGSPLTYGWSGDCGTATGPAPIVFCPWQTGANTVRLVVNDGRTNSDPAFVNIKVVDTTPPTVTANKTPPDFWTNQNVTVSFLCSDLVSGLASVSDTDVLSHEGKDQTAMGTCTDRAGNSASTTLRGINIDKTPPTIIGSRTPGPNTNGWNNADVTLHFDCVDTLSDVASCPSNIVLTHEGKNQSASGTATDLAGNIANATVSGISIDKTPPVIRSVQEGQAFILGQTIFANAQCTDALSGVDTCTLPTGPLDTSTVGPHFYTVSATDLAGNPAILAVHYDVHYVFAIVAPKPSNNRFQAGGTFPVRFQLKDASGNFVSTAKAQIWVDSITNPGISSGSANTGNYFRYDSAGSQYIFNLSTKVMRIGAHNLYVTLDDGTTYSIVVTLTS